LRVPDKILLGVGFVGEVISGDLSLNVLNLTGTAFVVSVPAPLIPGGGGGLMFCVVTARHLIKNVPNTELVVAVNQRGGGITKLHTAHDWQFHPDASVDVAIAHIVHDTSAEVAAFTVEDFFNPANPGNTGIGDEVFFPSLFSFHYGDEQRIQPILRHGNLAMLPNKQIQTEYGFADVYLIEARSIGGISGSPVYIRETIAVRVTNQAGEKPRHVHGLGEMKLLGLMHGHWDIDPFAKNVQTLEADPKRGVNMGIAMVVPASKILEVINLPQMVSFREERQKQYLQKTTPHVD